jgi:hypothetical protein
MPVELSLAVQATLELRNRWCAEIEAEVAEVAEKEVETEEEKDKEPAPLSLLPSKWWVVE